MGLYNVGTHAFQDVVSGEIKYKDGKNYTLNTIHNFDAGLGKFFDYFIKSPYAENTILIITADHAHFPEPEYLKVARKDLRPFFVDRIPLIIYDPFHKLPLSYDAQSQTSVSLAPTVLHLTGIQKAQNAFMGNSLFEKEKYFDFGVNAHSGGYYLIKNGKVTFYSQISIKDRADFLEYYNYIQAYNGAEEKGLLPDL